MRKTEGGRVPLRPHLFQGNAVTLHSQSDEEIWLRVLFVYGPSEAHFE